MPEVPVNPLGGLSLPRKSVVRLTDRPDMTIDIYRGRKTTTQQQQPTQMGTVLLDYGNTGNYLIIHFLAGLIMLCFHRATDP